MKSPLRVLRTRCLLSLPGLCMLWSLGIAAEPDGEIPLYPDATESAAANTEVRDLVGGELRIRNVSVPTLTAFLPPKDKQTGVAVIVAPGGGFAMLSIKSEGEDVARWLVSRGITALVLKYRLNPSPAPTKEFESYVARLFQTFNRMSLDQLMQSPGAQQAMADGVQAMRTARAHATEWGIDPKRIGFVGFSAGGIVAMHVAMTYDPASRPDFVGVIYGANPEHGAVPEDAPPLFLAVAADDPLLATASTPIFTAWQGKHRLAELHIYEKGGHGFGMNQHGTPSDHWIDEFFWWMESQTPLPPAGAASHP